jgi:hypothetical protein
LGGPILSLRDSYWGGLGWRESWPSGPTTSREESGAAWSSPVQGKPGAILSRSTTCAQAPYQPKREKSGGAMTYFRNGRAEAAWGPALMSSQNPSATWVPSPRRLSEARKGEGALFA